MAEWAKIDVGFFRHPQVCQLSQAAALGFLRMILYAQEHETDGAIPVHALRMFGVTNRHASDIERVGLIVRDGDEWKIGSFTKWQKSREQLEAERVAARERRARHRAKAEA